MQFRPQPGFQEKALSTSADIAILGGAAGCGKTFVELMEPLRHMKNGKFRCVIFRRTMPQIKGPGGLWDASQKIYPFIGARPRETLHDWTFPSGANVLFKQIEYEKNLIDWQGTEIDLIQFDELTHFTLKMFTYFQSRGRTFSGINPYQRGTCNPDPDSWVANFIDWWIDQDTGFPIEERSGKIRYMTCVSDTFVWGDTPEEVIALAPSLLENETVIEARKKGTIINPIDLVKSVTFIPGKLSDNAKLLQTNPGYLGSLLSLPDAERAMLLDGNWKIRLDGLELFDYKGIQNVFDNYPDKTLQPTRCITCDAARFGRDHCVIMVWRGWEVIHITVFKKSDVHDIVGEIERLRNKFSVMKSDVIIDQDGVGGDSVKLGDYTPFNGGHPAKRDSETMIIEFYKNLKTQCYYRMAKRVNEGQVRINVTPGTCLIYEDGKLKPILTTKIKVGSKVWDVRDLIKADLRAIKRAKVDIEGKHCINQKEEQKIILDNRSPDYGDSIMMREYVELLGKRAKLKRVG